MRTVWAACACALAAVLLPAAPAAAADYTGACAPTVVSAGSDATIPIPITAPVGATATSINVVWSGGDNADLVMGVQSTDENLAGLVAGVSGDSGNVTFADAVITPVASLVPVGGTITGVAAPLEPLSALSNGTGAVWALLIMNLSDTDLTVDSCLLTVSTVDAVPAAAGGDSTLASSGYAPAGYVVAGILIVGCGVALVAATRARTRRRAMFGVAVIAAVALVAGMSLTPAESAQADIGYGSADPQPYVWGTPANGLLIRNSLAPWGNAPGLAAYPAGCYHTECAFQLTDGQTDSSPAISPTGMKVAFSREVDLPVPEGWDPCDDFGNCTDHITVGAVHILDLRTGAVTRVTGIQQHPVLNFTTTHATSPQWTSDEQAIYFTDLYGIWRVDVGFNPGILVPGPEHVFDDPGVCDAGYIDNLTLSPDDRTLLYRASNCGDLITVPIANPSGAVKLTDSFGRADFSPDGTLIAAPIIRPRADFGWTDAVVLIDAATGSEVKELAGDLVSRGSTYLSWSPDGSRIAFSGEQITPDGTPYTTEIDCLSGFTDARTLCDQVEATDHIQNDIQCAPGSCLSGVVVRMNSNDNQLRPSVNLSGAVTGFTGTDVPFFQKLAPGSHTVNLTGDQGFVKSVVCDDNDSTATTSAISFRVAESEIVTCVLDVGVANDRDGDGITNDIDECPDDPTNECNLDTDNDGTPDHSDPCPDDPNDACVDPEDPDPTETCKPYEVDLTASIIGSDGAVPMLAFSTTGTVCEEGTRTWLKNGSAFTEYIAPPALAGLLKPFVDISFDQETPVVIPMAGGIGATVAAEANMCWLPLPGIAKVVSKLAKTAVRFGAERLVKKAVNYTLTVWMKALAKISDNLPFGGKLSRYLEENTDVFFRSAADLTDALLDRGVDFADFCISTPLWVPEIGLVADGDQVRYEIVNPDPGLALVTDVTHTLNAVP